MGNEENLDRCFVLYPYSYVIVSHRSTYIPVSNPSHWMYNSPKKDEEHLLLTRIFH